MLFRSPVLDVCIPNGDDGFLATPRPSLLLHTLSRSRLSRQGGNRTTHPAGCLQSAVRVCEEAPAAEKDAAGVAGQVRSHGSMGSSCCNEMLVALSSPRRLLAARSTDVTYLDHPSLTTVQRQISPSLSYKIIQVISHTHCALVCFYFRCRWPVIYTNKVPCCLSTRRP